MSLALVFGKKGSSPRQKAKRIKPGNHVGVAVRVTSIFTFYTNKMLLLSFTGLIRRSFANRRVPMTAKPVTICPKTAVCQLKEVDVVNNLDSGNLILHPRMMLLNLVTWV